MLSLASLNTEWVIEAFSIMFAGHRWNARLPVSNIPPEDRLYEQPLVAPQVSHFRQVPLRTMVKLPHSVQDSPT